MTGSRLDSSGLNTSRPCYLRSTVGGRSPTITTIISPFKSSIFRSCFNRQRKRGLMVRRPALNGNPRFRSTPQSAYMLRAELQPPPSRSLFAAESEPRHEVSELENRGDGLSGDRTLGILRKCRKKAVRVSSFSNLFVLIDGLQGFRK